MEILLYLSDPCLFLNFRQKNYIFNTNIYPLKKIVSFDIFN